MPDRFHGLHLEETQSPFEVVGREDGGGSNTDANQALVGGGCSICGETQEKPCLAGRAARDR